MNVKEISDILNTVYYGDDNMLYHEVEYAFASDLMSDVLTVKANNLLLITGLVNIQSIRTAEMSDISCIIYVRGKKISEDIKQLAKENGIILLECKYSMFKTCGILFQNGIKPIY
jgi:predicted transcriptional regulator